MVDIASLGLKKDFDIKFVSRVGFVKDLGTKSFVFNYEKLLKTWIQRSIDYPNQITTLQKKFSTVQ